MKKLKLNLDDLKVESFLTSSKTNGKGTIHGNVTGGHEDCHTEFGYPTCDEAWTCARTCEGTCEGNTCTPTCPNTCEGYTCDNPFICP